jgi:phage antirepressor YoqD-like protein
MTSLELVEFINIQRADGAAELRHDHFMAKVPKVLGEKDAPNFRGIYKDAYGREKPCYIFPKREACLMAMSYSYDLQANVFDKMTELEARIAQPTIAIPQTLHEALRLAADLSEQKEVAERERLAAEAKLAIAAPKAEALDLMSLADGEVCLQTAGKLLQPPPNKFISWLRSLGTWIFKRHGSSRNSAYTDKINAGYLAVRTVTTIMPDGSERVNEQVVVTPKGLVKLAQMLGVSLGEGQVARIE